MNDFGHDERRWHSTAQYLNQGSKMGKLGAFWGWGMIRSKTEDQVCESRQGRLVR